MFFEGLYTVVGGLGMFFFGMKNLSEALQSIAGSLIRRIINAITSNPVLAAIVGTVVTMLVQSSSITTVMVVGLVNAGLMNLTQAIGVIMGANIGTTITGWIIAIKVGKYGLLFVGLGMFPWLFSRKDHLKNIGKVLVALGFIFLGLEFMSQAFKPLRSNADFLSLLKYFTADSLFTLLACIFLGASLTAVVQSSSAMLGITIALASTGAITFQTAAALVLGENIGTTITAILAGIGGNTDARRAARAHALFNLLGVLIMIPFFWLYISLIDTLIPGAPEALLEDGSKPHIAAHIAAGHTLFNVINTIIWLPFVGVMAKVVVWLTPAPKMKEKHHLKYLLEELEISPSLGLAAADKEIVKLSETISRLLHRMGEYVTKSAPEARIKERVEKLEQDSDDMQTEVTLFLCKLQESHMSFAESSRSYALIRAADELESVGDYCLRVVSYRERLQDSGESFSPEAIEELRSFISKVEAFFQEVADCIQISHKKWNLEHLHAWRERLKDQAEVIRENHRKRLEKRDCTPIAGMIFSDIVVGLRKINSHIINVAEALSGRSLQGE